jgi:hypothetical protein
VIKQHRTTGLRAFDSKAPHLIAQLRAATAVEPAQPE